MSVASNYDRRMRVNFGWIGESYNIFKRDAGTWVAAVFVSGIAAFVIAFVFEGTTYFAWATSISHGDFTFASKYPQNPILEIASSLVGGVVQAFFGAGLYQMGNKAVHGERISLSDLFSGGPTFLNFLLYSIVFVIFYYLGLLLCFIGIFPVAMLLYPGFAMVANGEGVGGALNTTFENMKQDWLNGGLFAFVFFLLYCVSMLPLFLGLFVTVPMAIIIACLAFRDMPIADNMMPPGASSGSWPPAPVDPSTDLSGEN